MEAAFVRRVYRLLASLALALAGLAAAAQTLEGRWIGQAGPPDNRATLGLEIIRAADGSLVASAMIDLLSVFGQPLGPVTPTGPGVYAVPAAELVLTMDGDVLTVAGLLHEPRETVRLSRAARLPVRAPRPAVPAGPGPRWRTRLGGAVLAPVAVADGVAYVGNVDGVMTAVDVADGHRIWSVAAGRPIFAQALAAEAGVFFVCDNGYLFRLDRRTGAEVWRYDLGDSRVRRVLPNPFVHDYDYRAPRPILVGGVLYVGSGDGSLHAVRADTGERVWRAEGTGAIRETAAVSGSQLLVASRAGLVRAIDRDTGATRWQFDAKEPVTAPVLIDGIVIFGSRSSMLYGLDAREGRIRWSHFWWGSWIESAAVRVGSDIYIGSGDLHRVSRIDPRDGTNRWRSDVGGWVLQEPLVTDAVVYAGVSGARRAAAFWPPQASGLAALNRATGQVLWHWPAPDTPGQFLHGFVAAPVMSPGGILIGGVDGSLYCFPISP